MQQLHDYLERSVKEFGSEMSRHYAPGITALFEPLDQQLAAGRSALSDREKGLTEDLAELRRAKQRIEFILREEGAQNKEAVPA